MESAALIWFFVMLFSSGVIIGYDASQKEEAKKNPPPVVQDAGPPSVWKGTESSSTRSYWETPVPRLDQLPR